MQLHPILLFLHEQIQNLSHKLLLSSHSHLESSPQLET